MIAPLLERRKAHLRQSNNGHCGPVPRCALVLIIISAQSMLALQDNLPQRNQQLDPV